MEQSPWKVILTAFAIVAVLGAAGTYAFRARPAVQIVVQLRDADSSSAVAGLRSLAALVEAGAGERMDLDVVVTDPAARLLRRGMQPQAGLIERLQGQGVQFAIGQDTMDRLGLRDQDMPLGFLVVPSGTLEIARLERGGFGYLSL